MHSVSARRTAWVIGAICVVLTGALPPVATPAAAREPAPSAAEVARARETVRERKAEFGKAAVALATAKARLHDLTAAAERAIEAYNGARVRLARARDAHALAVERAEAAEEHLARARADVALIASRHYGGMDLSPTMVSMAIGRAGSVHEASMLYHLSDQRGQVLQRMRDAQEVSAILREQAARALAEWRAEAERTRLAKAAAREAVRRQRRETRVLRRTARTLESRLDRARSHADLLARRRAAARAARAAMRAPTWGGSSRRRGDIAADWALTQLGKPYVWAADGPDSYDCSGLTMRAWERAGVRLDHWTGTQWTSGPHIPLDRLRRGDLVFFGRITSNPGDIHHVGIYLGRGMMVHAPQTGDVVRIAPIWRPDLVGATRPA